MALVSESKLKGVGMPEKTFQAVPDSDALGKIERDLRFHPTVNDGPCVLTKDQIARFNESGYLRPFRVFSSAEIAEIRAYFDRLLDEYAAAGKDSYSISSAHLRHGRVYDILTHPPIVALAKDILGENVIGWGSHFFCKMPGDGKAVAWHQDASYWPLSPSKAVTVWLAIDDADPQNANMRFIAGSHHVGHLTYRPSESTEHNVLNQTIENAEQYGPVVEDTLAAGECSLHSDLLLHGSLANASTRRRCGLTLRYAAAEVRAGMDWNEKGVIVAGSDASGHWRNPARPAID